MKKDENIEGLIELDGVRFVIDESLGLWVKFEIKQVKKTPQRPHGIRYSLSLHDRFNARLLGFDNAHAVEYGGKTNVAPKYLYDHWHRAHNDEGRPYFYENATKLLEDFWLEVDKAVKNHRGE